MSAQALEGGALGRGRRHRHLGQRLAVLDGGPVARRAAELDRAAGDVHVEGDGLVEGGGVGQRPVAQVHALGRGRVDRAHEVLVDLLGHERRVGREQLGERHEAARTACGRRPACRGRSALPEAPAAAPHVPVGELVDEVLDGARPSWWRRSPRAPRRPA